MNVAVISPQILMRRALCALLAQVRDVRVVADFDRAVENCEALQKTQADLLVIDSLEPLRDLETVAHLRKLLPGISVLLLSDTEDEDFQVRAVKAGVRGCFSKRPELQAFERALRAIGQRGEVWVSHQAAAQKFMQGDGNRQSPANRLTEREWEILALVASGCHNKEVATRLFISENTIKTHLYTVYKKLGVSSRLGAAMHYFQQARQEPAPPKSRGTHGLRTASGTSATIEEDVAEVAEVPKLAPSPEPCRPCHPSKRRQPA